MTELCGKSNMHSQHEWTIAKVLTLAALAYTNEKRMQLSICAYV